MTIPGRSDEIGAEEKKKQKSLRDLDLAYGCYAYTPGGVPTKADF
jgi:hypothetical protein